MSLIKPCVMCGQECDGLPRIKNERGQYAHRSCVEEAQRDDAADPLVDADEIGLEDDGISMDDLLAEAGPAQATAAAMSCGNCGSVLAPGAVLCTTCGFNSETGRTLRSAKAPGKAAGLASGTMSAAGGAGGAVAVPILWIIGGGIGGAIGAAVWAAIAVGTGFEIGWIAIGIGFLTGLGVVVAGQGRGEGMIAGGVAALLALGAVAAGKYATVSILVDRYFENEIAGDMFGEIDNRAMLEMMAFEIVSEKVEAGHELEWPNPEIILDVAWWPDDYPEDLVVKIEQDRSQMSAADVTRSKDAAAAEYNRQGTFGMLSEDSFEPVTAAEIDEDWMLTHLANAEVRARWAAGESVEWPDPSIIAMSASWPHDYPREVSVEAQSRFNALTPEELQAKKDQHAADMRESVQLFKESFADSFKEQGFIASLDLFDALWLFLAMGAAFKVASGDD